MGPYKTKQQSDMVLYGFKKNLGKYKNGGTNYLEVEPRGIL